MIPGDAREGRLRAEQFDAFVRLGPVTHDIAEAPGRVHIRLGQQDLFQGRQIAMNVGQDKDLQTMLRSP